jgi:hypothetical protein
MKWASPPTIIMICIDIQGEEHHCREEQGIVGFLGNPALNQPIEMRILTNLKDTVAPDVPIGRIPICARHSTKSRVISQRFVGSKRALGSPDFLMMLVKWPRSPWKVFNMSGGSYQLSENFLNQFFSSSVIHVYVHFSIVILNIIEIKHTYLRVLLELPNIPKPHTTKGHQRHLLPQQQISLVWRVCIWWQ